MKRKLLLALCLLTLCVCSCQKDTVDENLLTGIYDTAVEGAYSYIVPVEDGYYAVEWQDNTKSYEAVFDGDEVSVYLNLVHLDENGGVTDTVAIADSLNTVQKPALAWEDGVFVWQDEELWCFDWNGEITRKVSLETVVDGANNRLMQKNGDGFVLITENTVSFLDGELGLLEQWDKPKNLSLIGRLSGWSAEENCLWCVTNQSKDKKTTYVLEKWQQGEVVESYELHETITNNFLSSGVDMVDCEDGWFYGWSSASGVFRWQYTMPEGEVETVLDFSLSGIGGNSVESIQKQPGEEAFIVTLSTNKDPYNTMSSTINTMRYLVNAPDRRLDEMTVLNLVCAYADTTTQEAVLRFNQTHEDAYIRLIDYAQYGASYSTDVYNRLELELTTGLLHADILCTESSIPMLDLYPFMNGEIQPEDIAQCVKNAYEVDGKLYEIGTNILFSSPIGKRESFGELTHWNLEQFLDYVDNLGEDEYMMEYVSQDSAQKLLSYHVYSNFIDGSTAHFDDPLYIRLLNYIATLPLEEDEIMEHGMDNREQLVAGDFDGESQVEYVPGGENLYYTGKLKLYNNEYGSGQDFRYLYDILRWCKYFCTTDITLIGYPINADSGVGVTYSSTSYSIPANCTDPALAWSFIESILLDSKTVPDTGSKAYENMNFQFTTLKKPYMTYLENLATMEGIGVSLDEEAREYSGVTKLTVDETVINWMNLLYDTAGYQASVTRDVRNIIKEEMSRFLAGAATAEACADATQSRVQLYLSEKE